METVRKNIAMSEGPAADAATARIVTPPHYDEWRPAGANFKSMPQAREQRELIRAEAARAAAQLPRHRPPAHQTLFDLARRLLKPLGLDDSHVGFAMVLLNNEYWRAEFAAVPFQKRLVLLPQCLRSTKCCPAGRDNGHLLCKACGQCPVAELSGLARRLGCRVLVAEGTPGVLKLIAGGEVDAILGVACLNVLEKAFEKVLQVGVPALAIPLLRDSCRDTAVDEEWVIEALGYHGPGVTRTRSFVPLLRAVGRWFDPAPLAEILPVERAGAPQADRAAATERIAMAWVEKGGKRFRPFVTAAAWQALTGRDDPPLHVKRAAAAMELFHKASLIHDDIEDDDDCRYGGAALHRAESIPVALNVGDYLIGRGYRLVADQMAALGAETTALILQRLTHAHIRLTEGQGAELLWRRNPGKSLAPLECLQMYALKTAPAFAAALYAGAVMGGGGEWEPQIAEFAKHLGVAYQIQNDLKDLDGTAPAHGGRGTDILRGRPTVLFAMALEAADDAERAELLAAADGARAAVSLERLRAIYDRYHVPQQAALLAETERTRALSAVADVTHEGLNALFSFLGATLLD
jgi:geranylgeranyl pyrophosphate synthase